MVWSKVGVCFAEGVRIIGCVEPLSVFRPLAEPTGPVDGSTNSFRGDAAVCFVDEYLSKPLPRDAELVTKLVFQEEMKGHQSIRADGHWREAFCQILGDVTEPRRSRGRANYRCSWRQYAGRWYGQCAHLRVW